MIAAHLDFETYSPVDLKSAGLSRYITSPDADVLCCAYAIGDEEPELWIPGDPLPFRLFEADKWIAWNAAFERATWWLLYRKYGWPDCPTIERWRCAQAVALSFALPAALDQAADALLVPQRKDPKGKKLIQLFCVPERKTGKRTLPNERPDDFLDLLDYCAQDVRSERAVLHACPRHELIPAEQARWQHQITINERGFYADVTTARAASLGVTKWKQRLSAECKAITKTLEPTQRAAIFDWLREQDVEIANMRANTIRDVLKKMPEGDAKRVLEIRAAASKTSTKKYDVLQRCVSRDSRVRYTQIFHGAGTGRVTHKLFQPGNMPRGDLMIGSDPFREAYLWADKLDFVGDPDQIDIVWEPMAFYSAALRSMIVAAPGKVLFAGDYAQIEARMNAYQSGETRKLQAFVDGRDLYRDMASVIYSLAVEFITKESRERQVGKSAELGAGFGLGAAGFQRYCKEQASIEITMDEAERAISAYREMSPMTVKNWHRVQRAALNAIRDPGNKYPAGLITYACSRDRKWLFSRLPSGRALAYCRPRIALDKFGRPEQILVAGVHPKMHRWVENLRVWHGSLVNNNVQGSCRDIMVDAMLRLEARGFRVVLSVHDEAISEGAPEQSLEEYLAVMSEPVAWAPGLPIKVEGWAGRRYRKG